MRLEKRPTARLLLEVLEARLPLSTLHHLPTPPSSNAITPGVGPHANLDGGDLGTTAAKASGGGGGGGFQSHIVGNASNANVTPTSGGLALVGGGIDVDAVFTWMGAKANGGDFVVLRASGTDAYNPYIADLVPSLDSVETLIIKSHSGADSDYVFNAVRNAEAIFIAGGDQADYITLFKDTRLESAIYEAIGRGAPIGGTSAGLAVLGEFDFSALRGTIEFPDALASPYDRKITIDQGLLTPKDDPGTPLDYMKDTITDSHFQQRDRMGRLLTFMARIDKDGLVSASEAPRGIGINESTALLVEPNGSATVVGNPNGVRAVFFLEGTTDPTVIASGQPLTYAQVKVTRAEIGDKFNLASWTGVGLDSYFLSVNAGVVTPDQVGGSIY